MYSRYGLYFRFTALQTVCKYDQLNPGKKKVLSFTLRGKSIQKLIIGTNFHIFQFTVKTQPLILDTLISFIYNVHMVYYKKMVEKLIRITVQLFRQMSTDPGCSAQISSSSSLLHTGWEFLFPALRWNPCPLKLQLLFDVLLLALLIEWGIFVAIGW